MTAGPAPRLECGEHHCITCGDDGVAMMVLEMEREPGLARCVDEDGARSSVEIALVEPVRAGDRVLVHAGVALTTLSRAGCPAVLTADAPQPVSASEEVEASRPRARTAVTRALAGARPA